MQDGQHGAVSFRGEKFIELPGGGKRAGLGFAVAHRDSGDELRVIRHGAEGVSQGVAELAALIDGAGGLGSHMARDAAGEGEALEEAVHALTVLADIRVDLLIAAVQPVLGDHGVAAVAGAGEVDHVQVKFLDDAVEMRINEVLTGTGSPVADDLFLDVLCGEWLFKQGIIQQIELAGGEVIGGAPVFVHRPKLGLGCGSLCKL